MLYSRQSGGFYSREIHGDNTPPDAVEITAEYHAALLAGQSAGKVIVADESGYPVLESTPVLPPQVPSRVTMRQARLALHDAGLLTVVESAIDAMPEPPKTTARIEWDYASEVHRASAFVALLSAALELDEQALDNLFLKAVEL